MAWSSWSCGRWWWGAGWGCRRWGWCPAVFWYKILVIFRCFPLEYAFEDQNIYYLFKLFENLSREGFQFDFGKVYSLEPPLPPFVFFLKKIKKKQLWKPSEHDLHLNVATHVKTHICLPATKEWHGLESELIHWDENPQESCIEGPDIAIKHCIGCWSYKVSKYNQRTKNMHK